MSKEDLIELNSLTLTDKLLLNYYMVCKFVKLEEPNARRIISYLDGEKISDYDKERAELTYDVLDYIIDNLGSISRSELKDYLEFRVETPFVETDRTLETLTKFGLIYEVDEKRHIYSICDNYKDILSKCFEEIEEYKIVHKELKKIETEQIESVIEKFDKKYDIQDIDYVSANILNDKNKLIDYLKNIVELDSDIYSLKKRYKFLINRKLSESCKYFYDIFNANKKILLEKQNLQKEISDLERKINSKPILSENIEVVLPKKPIKPVFNEKKPEEPIYKKVGLFNKNRIENENNIIKQQYEENLKKYNDNYDKYIYELTKFEKDMDTYNLKVKQLEAEAIKNNKELYEKELIEYEKNLEENNKLLAIKNNELMILTKTPENKRNEILSSSENYITIKSIDYELEYIKECIEKNIKVEKELYSYNVIYGKYRNIIAISSFLDYFMSGRCDKLDTNTGAYNLYEQESRTDVIINKMDVIIESLSQIKENQYYIYNQLNMIQNSLESIESQLLVNNMLQTVQVKDLNQIIDKADKIAYNTEVTAYYSKKNANYTKAIAFMHLMDRL